MTQPLGVFENIRTTPRRKLFRFLGVDWVATPYAWLSVPNFLAAGIVLALVSRWGEPVGEVLRAGVISGVLLFVMNIVHTIGHILGGHAVNAVMDANLVTATRHINLYLDDPPDLPRRVHLSRAGGGPLLNIAVGLVIALVGAGAWVSTFGMYNLVAGIGSLAPVHSVDGEVIWRELRKSPKTKDQ